MTEKEILKLDTLTRELCNPRPCEDPYCCTPTRHIVVNRIRIEFGLEAISFPGDQKGVSDFIEMTKALLGDAT